MKSWTRSLGLAALALLAVARPASAQVMIVPSTPVIVPTQSTAYTPATVTQTYVARTPVGPAAYIAPTPVVVTSGRRYVTTTTTLLPAPTYTSYTTARYVPAATILPATTIVNDPALVPVGYEVVRPGRTKVVVPRQVYRYRY